MNIKDEICSKCTMPNYYDTNIAKNTIYCTYCREELKTDKIKTKKKTKINTAYELETASDGNLIYWFNNKEDLLKWVKFLMDNDVTIGTVDVPRFGGNFIDVEFDEFEKLIGWVFPDAKRIGISGDDGKDVIVDIVLVDPKEGIDTKTIRRKGHIYKADEVSDTDEGYVRMWWD